MRASTGSSFSRSDSITSENELLTMSYARSTEVDASCTEEEKEQIAQLPQSTFTSFVSPAERKRRQLAKLEAMKKEEPTPVAAVDPVREAQDPLTVATKDDPKDGEGGSSDDSSDDESSSSDTTSRISNVNSISPKSSGSNEEKKLDAVPESDVMTGVSAPVADEDFSEIPLESDAQKRKRAAIQEIMRDPSISQADRNKKIQDVIAGKVGLGNVEVPPSPQAPGEHVEAAVIASETDDLNATSPDEDVSEIPLESDVQKRKRAAIQEVMKDSSLNQMEKNKKVQDIISGKVDLSSIKVQEAPRANIESPSEKPTVVLTAAVSSEVASSEEVTEVAQVNAPPTSVADGELSSQPPENAKVQATAVSVGISDDLDANYQRNVQRGLELKSQQKYKENPDEDNEQVKISSVASVPHDLQVQFYEQKQKELEMQLEQQRKEMEFQMEMQRKTMELEQQRQRREIEMQQQLELEMARQRRLEMEQQQREMEFQAEQKRLREEAENRRQADRHRLEMERMRDLERQQTMRQMRQEKERQVQEELDRQRQVDMSRQADMSRAYMGSDHSNDLSAVAAAKTLMSRMNFFRPPRSIQAKSSKYDGIEDDELNWRLDCYSSLSDFTIVVHRALPGPFAPDFDVADINLIDAALGADGSPVVDVYYVHKVMLAVGGARSELLGRRIRDAEMIMESEGSDGQAISGNVHETILLGSAADAFEVVLDFCYFPDKPVNLTLNNAVPLVYLSKKYKIRALLVKAEAFVKENLKSTNAVHFLLDAYLFKLDEILCQAIDVTAAHFDDRVDFKPIYELPIQLFRRIIASTSLKCESELLSLVVYSYCGEHHRDEVDIDYFRELTRPKLIPDIDSKVALMMLKFYVDLILDGGIDRDIMEVLYEDNLAIRCIAVISKNWRQEICEPLMIDAEWEESAAITRRNLPPHEPAALHRSLPSQLQNRILEKCLLVAMVDNQGQVVVEKTGPDQTAKDVVISAPQVHTTYDNNNEAIIRSLRSELDEAKKQSSSDTQQEIETLRKKAAELEAEVKKKSKALEEYRQELKRFRRVPGIHSFGSISKKDPTIIDKTTCTYSANPDHHYPNHRRGNRPPTQMPTLSSEFGNLGKQNGYVYNDGHGALLPVFYYDGDR